MEAAPGGLTPHSHSPGPQNLKTVLRTATAVLGTSRRRRASRYGSRAEDRRECRGWRREEALLEVREVGIGNANGGKQWFRSGCLTRICNEHTVPP